MMFLSRKGSNFNSLLLAGRGELFCKRKISEPKESCCSIFKMVIRASSKFCKDVGWSRNSLSCDSGLCCILLNSIFV